METNGVRFATIVTVHILTKGRKVRDFPVRECACTFLVSFGEQERLTRSRCLWMSPDRVSEALCMYAIDCTYPVFIVKRHRRWSVVGVASLLIERYFSLTLLHETKKKEEHRPLSHFFPSFFLSFVRSFDRYEAWHTLLLRMYLEGVALMKDLLKDILNSWLMQIVCILRKRKVVSSSKSV